MIENEKEYFECQCSYPTHQLKFEYDPEYDELTVWTQVRNWRGFFARLRAAFRYVFKMEDLAWDCSLVKGKDIPRMLRIVEKVQNRV